ncbi:hypothetical protein Pst134EB_008709 [Puccinia striiformis f. sp. tritici]|nr:hypothetical protein Pst134EB_008709 [Puccinia striiformis f. sp. tritici]
MLLTTHHRSFSRGLPHSIPFDHLDICPFNSDRTPPPSRQVDTLRPSDHSHITPSSSSNMLHNNTITHHRSFSRGLPHSIPFVHLDICPFNSDRTPPPSRQVVTLRPSDHSHITLSSSFNMLHITCPVPQSSHPRTNINTTSLLFFVLNHYSINTLQHTQSLLYSTLDHCSILAQMVQSAHPNFRAQTVDTRGTSRRNRTQRGWERNALQEQAKQDVIQRDIRTSQRLGHVDADHDPGPAVWEDIDGAHHADYEPHISSNTGQGLDEYIADLPSAAHASYHRARRYAEKRDRLHKEWLQLEQKTVAAYLLCQKNSANWTFVPKGIGWDGYTPISCSCVPSDIRSRNVACYDIISVISASAFVKGLSAFLDARKAEASYARGGKYSKRNLRVPFSHSVDLYARILVNRRKILDVGLQLIRTDLWAAKCPRCFGPKQSEVKADPCEPCIMVMLDGNFQQRHYTHASKDNPDDSQYPRDFIPPSNISPDATAIAATDSAAAGIDPPCSDKHKAANDTRGKNTWEKCDDTGLFASTCRHDIPLMFVNIYKSGEKLYYPVTIIRNLLADFPGHKVGILYDLGCHLESHVRKRNLLLNRQSDLRFATSVFHAYVHEWSCQVKYNPRFNSWWGLTDGEGLERLWSFLSPLVSTLRVSTRQHRLNAIQARADYYTDQLNGTAAHWLLNKLEHAQEVQDSALRALAELYAQPNRFTPGRNYSSEFLNVQWRQEQAYHLNSNQTAQSQAIELGRLLCLTVEVNQSLTRPMTAAQMLARINTINNLAAELATHCELMGPQIGANVTATQADELAKLWYTKTELRRGFLALAEERQPLIRVTRPGESTTLRTHGQQSIMRALRERSGKLKIVLETYNTQAQAFKTHHPRIDPLTQTGIRHLAYYRRSVEEIRRLGWEARRAMAWGIEHHSRLLLLVTNIMGGVHTDDLIPDVAHPPGPGSFVPILNHTLLDSLENAADKIDVAFVVLHVALHAHLMLQLEWNEKIVHVFEKTHGPTQHAALLSDWKTQVERIQYVIDNRWLSGIPGAISFGLVALMNGGDRTEMDLEEVEPDPDEDNSDNEDDLEEAYLEDIGRILAATLLEDLEPEAGGATDGAGRTREEYGADVGPAAGSNVQPIEV